MNLSIKISDQRIAELLCAGFEGGVGYWCRIMDTREPAKVEQVLDAGRGDGQVWPFYDYPLTGGATVCRIDDGETEEDDEEYVPLVLDRTAINRGLAVMQQKYARHFGDFLAEREDATTGDVFIQCCLLGEVIYG